LRHCADGSRQKKGVNFDYSYSPTAAASSVRFTLRYAAFRRFELALLDVENAFQILLTPPLAGEIWVPTL
jgi:hypothetical protein